MDVSTANKGVKLRCEPRVEGEPKEEFNLEPFVIDNSKTFTDLLEDLADSSENISVDVPYSKDIFETIALYYKMNNDNVAKGTQKTVDLKRKLTEWENQFCDSMTKEHFYKVLEACNSFHFQYLMDTCCIKTARKMETMTIEQIKQELGIVDDQENT